MENIPFIPVGYNPCNRALAWPYTCWGCSGFLKMYLEYIFSAAFAYVGHDKKEVSVGQFQISPQGEEVARCVEQIVV